MRADRKTASAKHQDWWPVLEGAEVAVLVVEIGAGTLVRANAHARTLLDLPSEALDGAPVAAFDPSLAARGPGEHESTWRTGERSVHVGMRISRLSPDLHAVVAWPIRPGGHPSILDWAEDPSPDHITVLDAQRRVQFTSRQASRGVDPAAIIGEDVFTFVRPEHRERVRRVIDGVFETGQSDAYELEIDLPEGGTARNLSRVGAVIREGEVVGVTIASEDIGRRQRVERDRAERTLRLLHHQRFQALGQLVSGITHDITSPLSVVLSQLDHATKALAEERPQLALALAEALDNAEQIRHIVQTVRPFARQEGEPEWDSLPQVLDGALRIAGNQLRHRALLERSYEAGLPAVLANPGQLGQAVLNLLINALQALPEGPGGVVTLSAERREELLVVTVRDNGAGVPPSLGDTIFEPFFTTRPYGEGSGLGLSSARQIARDLGGDVVLVPTQRGAVFELRLPAPSTVPARRGLDASTRILVVDDETRILRMLKRLLRDLPVSVADTAKAALESIERRPPELILCDLMMPDMSGRQFYERVVAQRPELASAFVFMSGGVIIGELREFLRSTGRPLLDKPFRREELVELLEKTAAERQLDLSLED